MPHLHPPNRLCAHPPNTPIFSAGLRSAWSPLVCASDLSCLLNVYGKRGWRRESSATHSKGLCPPGPGILGLGSWCWKLGAGCKFQRCPIPKPSSYRVQTNAGFPSLATNVTEGSAVPACSMASSLFPPEQLRSMAVPPRRLRLPSRGPRKSSTRTSRSKSSTTHPQPEISRFNFCLLFSLDLPPIISKLVFNKSLTAGLISLISEGNFSQLR